MIFFFSFEKGEFLYSEIEENLVLLYSGDSRMPWVDEWRLKSTESEVFMKTM